MAAAAAAAWKFLKISLCRRRPGCIYFLSAAAQKFLKLSPSRRRRLYFFGKNRRRLSRSAYTSSFGFDGFGFAMVLVLMV
jgi:hypothetical protein